MGKEISLTFPYERVDYVLLEIYFSNDEYRGVASDALSDIGGIFDDDSIRMRRINAEEFEVIIPRKEISRQLNRYAKNPRMIS